jgi:hypothetical protein
MRKMLLALVSLLLLVGCRTSEKAAGDSTSAEQAGGSIQRCYYTIDGKMGRCIEYGAKLAPALKAEAKKVCGDESKGMKGFIWAEGACPTASIVGECVSTSDSSAYSHDYFYRDVYTAEKANKICSDWESTKFEAK